MYLFKYLRFRYLQRIRLSIRKKAVNSIIYRNKFYFNSDRFYSLCKQKSYRSLGILGKKRRILTLNVDYSVIRKVLILVGSLANFRLLYRVSDISSIFFNLRLVYILFSDLYFIGEILYLRPVQRFTFLFKFLLNKFSRKSMSQSLMTFISNSNAIYSFFIPYYCQILLRRVYRSRKLAGFNWLFFTQLSNLFFYLIYSNLHLHLNFSCSESLNKTLLHTMLQYFLTYNPPKMNFQFLKELCDVYLLTGITRDSNLLQNWVVRNLSIIFYRKH